MTIVVTLRHILLYCVHRTIAVGSTMIASYIHDTHTHIVLEPKCKRLMRDLTINKTPKMVSYHWLSSDTHECTKHTAMHAKQNTCKGTLASCNGRGYDSV